jgi:hypothetical protein
MTLVMSSPAGSGRVAPTAPLLSAALLVLAAWFVRDLGFAAEHAPDLAPAPATLATLALLLRGAGWLIEAGAYAIVWRALGRRLRWLPFAGALALLSLIDLLGAQLRAVPGWADAPLTTALAGAAAAPGGAGFAVAFAGCGLLTLARVMGSAALQARALGRGLGAPLALTTGCWVTTHLAHALALDLLRGASPL